jgi:hypothetical protein
LDVNERKYTGEGKTKKSAEKQAALKALYGLAKNGFISFPQKKPIFIEEQSYCYVDGRNIFEYVKNPIHIFGVIEDIQKQLPNSKIRFFCPIKFAEESFFQCEFIGIIKNENDEEYDQFLINQITKYKALLISNDSRFFGINQRKFIFFGTKIELDQ